MTSKTTYNLISADSHVLEPADIFEKRLPAGLRDRAPKLRDYEGGSAWFVSDNIEPVTLPRTAKTGSGYRPGTPLTTDKPIKYSDVLPALYDPTERLRAQDSDSVDAEILYPTPGLWDAIKMLDDKELQLALYKAYNDWIAEFCAHAPDRLIGLGLVPTTSVEDARAEVLRCAKVLKLRGMVLGALPSGNANAATDADDPFWAAANETGMVISIHVALGADASTMPAGGITPGLRPSMTNAIGPMVSSGLFDRFESLRLVMAHADAGWAMHWLEFSDMYYMRHRHLSDKTLKDETLLMSGYIRSRVWFTFHHDRIAVKNIHNLGPAHLMWASHFPYDDSNWPDDRQQATLITDGVAASTKAALLAGNVARLYRLPGYESSFKSEEVREFAPLVHY